MKEIELTKGKVAIVDDEDYDYLNQWSWCVDSRVTHARRRQQINGVVKNIWMHQEILGIKKGFVTDHINCNGLDNRKENLRFATKAQNSMNRNHKHRGIYKRSVNDNFRVYINAENRQIYLGDFETKEEALKARIEAEKIYFKEYAYKGDTK